MSFIRSLIVTLLVLWAIAASTCGADVAVGPAATGTGSGADWNNIADWDLLTFTRGNVYYTEDGNYNARDLTTATSGTTRITIKKAIESDHGPAAGWVATKGDGQMVITEGFEITTSYWTIDGQTGGGPSAWKTGFGIKITPSDSASGAILCSFGGSSIVSNLLIRHIEIIGPASGGSDNGKPVGIWQRNCEDSTFEYLYVNDMGSNIVFGYGKRVVYQYFWFGYFPSTPSFHGETSSLWGGNGLEDITFRWGVITHTEGTGGLIFGDSGGVGGYQIYGCVFAPLDGNSLTGGNGVVGTWTDYALTNMKVYNCTFISWSAPLIGIFSGGNDSAEFKNNMFYNGTSYGDFASTTRDSNHFASAGAGSGTNITTSTGDPFVNWASADFRLTSNTTAGANLGAPYNVDMFGNTRSTWTRGAIEFTEGAAPPPKTLNVTTLHIGAP